ncbi:MAG: hypothetical protein ABIP68_03565 [Ferruginibacter sp.]
MKMFFLAFILLLTRPLIAQNFTANYLAEFIVTPEKGDFKLPYKVEFYSSENKVISFWKPLYLNEYPNGYVNLNNKNIAIRMDSITDVDYVSLDSLIYRSYHFLNEIRKYKPEYYKWDLLPETRNINGLICQKATWVPMGSKNNEPKAEIWFCPDIPMPVSLMGMWNLPGLMVEINYYGFYTAKLTDYSFTSKISSDVYWPALFNKPFKASMNFENKKDIEGKKDKKKEEDKQLTDILNQ